jgi:hypothetical protein
MRRIRIGVLGVLALAPASWALGEPPGAPGAKADSPQARFEAIQKEYQQAQQEFSAAYSKATTDEERQKAFESKYPNPQKYVPRMMELAESAPNDPAAVDALVWVVQFGGQAKEADRAIEHLARDHAQDPKVGQISGRLVYSMSPAAESLLRAIAEKNPDRAAQGQASFALAQWMNNEAELVRRMKQDKEVAARVKQFYGAERTEALQTKDPEAMARQAESLFEAVIEKFGDVSHYRGDLAKAARAELYEIRNLGIGKTAPEISGEDLSGRPMKLSDYKGKVVVLDFWGDW